MKKKDLIKEITTIRDINQRNSMGCSENWYNPRWSVNHTFSKQELEQMTLKEINNLLKLAEAISDGLY